MSRAKKSGKKKMREANAAFEEKILKFARSHNASDADRQQFRDALGMGRLSDSMLASDLHLRGKSRQFLSQALLRMKRERPDLEFWFWTFTHSRGLTSDRDPVIDLKFIKSSTDKVLRKAGLDGIYVVEVQGLGNEPRNGKGRTLMTHSHALTWSIDKPDLSSLEAKLNRSKEWENGLGAPPVRVEAVADGLEHLKYLSYYLFKPPFDVKMAEERKNGKRLKGTIKGYRPEFAARTLELLSQLEIGSIVGACGEGKSIRQEWSRRLRNWHRSREKWAPGKWPAYHFDDLWDRYRQKKKRASYQAFQIVR